MYGKSAMEIMAPDMEKLIAAAKSPMSAIEQLAGEGRTTETVKGNADALAAHKAETTQKFTDVEASVSGLQSQITDTNATIALKADKTYVDDEISSVEQQISNIGDGSPKGTYATLADLQAAYPTGTTGIYIVTADGNWYYWNGTAWTAGGVYQSTGIADGSITPAKLQYKGKTANKGTIFPMKVMTRDGVISPERDYMNNAILDVKVIGAKKGKYYRIEWIGNGNTAWGDPNYEILFSEYNAAYYATDSSIGKRDIVVLFDFESTSPTEDIFTQVIEAEGFTFVVTLDYSVLTLPSYALNNPDIVGTVSDHGYTHIIDQDCYIYEDEIKNNKLELDIENYVANVYSKYGNNEDIKFIFKKLTVNQLFAIWNVYKKSNKAAAILPFDDADGAAIKSGMTDLIGPYVCQAVNNGDGGGGGSTDFTGGAHGTEGNATDGLPTAETVHVRYLVDGKPISTSGTYDGDIVDIYVKNKIMSNNTMTTARRYTHEEHVHYRIQGTKIDIDMVIIPLEEINISRYYGLQFTTAYYTKFFYPNGQSNDLISSGTVSNSGQRDQYRNDSIVLIKDNEILEMYVDGTVGIGTRDHTPLTSPMNFSTNFKVYNWLIGNGQIYTFNAGETISWRGYYDFRKFGE